MSCSHSYYIEIPECPEWLKLIAGLNPNTSYGWKITDILGNEYYDIETTDADGNLTIDTSLLPEGLLNRHAGQFTLEIIQLPDYYSESETLIFCEDQYDSVRIQLVQRDSNTTGFIICDK